MYTRWTVDILEMPNGIIFGADGSYHLSWLAIEYLLNETQSFLLIVSMN